MSNLAKTSKSALEITISGEPKHYNMKQFISAVNEYIQTRTEDSASLINRHLQLLSVAIDISIFDPNTSIVCEFFVSLHELLTSLEPRSSLAWCCVSVLTVACRNSAARNALIHTYQFIPALSRLLGDHLAPDKKVKLLSLMQELSCGLKISWQIPHLSHLMSTLARWIEKEADNEGSTTLSLGVLVNLCYKNLPAVYTLSRCVDIKRFLRMCSKLQGVKMEVNVCKLLIILDYVHGTVHEEAFVKLITVTFKSICEAYAAKDAILLRHIVEFYLDVAQQNNKTNVNNQDVFINKYENYEKEVEKLLQIVDNNYNGTGDAHNHTDPECMSVIFKFFHALIQLNLPKLLPLYPAFVRLSLRWIQTDGACSDALGILRTIAVTSKLEDENILKPLLSSFPLFLLGLQNIEEDTIMNIEHSKRLSSVMQLLRAMVQSESSRQYVISSLNEEMICKIFWPLIGNSSPRSRAGNANNCTSEAVSLYIHSFVLINELARCSPQWVEPLTTLLQHRQMHVILAEALYNGNQEIKSLILSMAAYPLFPYEQIATAMSELQPLVKNDCPNQSGSNNGNIAADSLMYYPVMSIAQIEKLDQTIQILKEACSQNHVVNISTSDVMELYEYKLASMGHAERAAMASVEAASQRCTHLQHQTAQLTAEISRIRQLFIHTQQCTEELHKTNKTLEQNNRDLHNRLGAEKGRNKVSLSQLATKERALQQKNADIEDMSKQIKQRDTDLAAAEEQYSKLQAIASKLEDNLKRQEKNVERKDEIIQKANSNIEHYKLQVVQFEREIKHMEMELKTKNKEMAQLNRELTEKSNVINTIFNTINTKK